MITRFMIEPFSFEKGKGRGRVRATEGWNCIPALWTVGFHRWLCLSFRSVTPLPFTLNMFFYVSILTNVAPLRTAFKLPVKKSLNHLCSFFNYLTILKWFVCVYCYACSVQIQRLQCQKNIWSHQCSLPASFLQPAITLQFIQLNCLHTPLLFTKVKRFIMTVFNLEIRGCMNAS